MTREEVIAAFSRLTMWASGGVRAPHKPLLVLYAIGQLLQGKDGVSFQDVERPLTGLLRAFGPSRRTQHPEDPFWRLRNDGIWEVWGQRPRTTAAGGARITDLRRNGNVGRFPEEMRTAFRGDPKLVLDVVLLLLRAHFPSSMHEDILSAVGLNLHQAVQNIPASLNLEHVVKTQRDLSVSRRNPDFRKKVLTAYEYRCAVCQMDLRIGTVPLALDAAHIKWHSAGGPDTVPNGLALCSIHHKVFDRGGFTISDDLEVLVSEHVMGTTGKNEVLRRFHCEPLAQPQREEQSPDANFLSWHRKEVFQSEALPIKHL